MKLAEQEGIGVDRTVDSKIRTGRPEPEIVELAGTMVCASLLGGSVDQSCLQWLALLTPEHTGRDLNALFRRILE